MTGQIGKRELAILSHLVKCTNWSNEDDGIRIIKVGHPRVALSSSSANVKKVPCHHFAMDVYVECVLRNSHCLNTGMKDIIFN